MKKIYPKDTEVVCKTCKQTRMVNKYYAKRAVGDCRKCCALKGSRSKKPSRVTGKDVKCLTCNNSFWRYKHLEHIQKFCSKDCADNNKRVYQKETRHCEFCGSEFSFSKKPHSNSSGRFCSVQCRDKSYLKPDKFSRSRWTTDRRKFLLAGNSFCFKCHRTENLQVHHLVPHHITKDNTASNLVTLCRSCHKVADRITLKAWKVSPFKGATVSAIIGASLEDSWHIFKGKQL